MVGRLKARDFGKAVVHGKFGQLEKLASNPKFLSAARVEVIKGVTCLIIEREISGLLAEITKVEAIPGNREYCVVLAPADVFGA